jgi:hypothetical protein
MLSLAHSSSLAALRPAAVSVGDTNAAHSADGNAKGADAIADVEGAHG